jgi:RNA polymerase sigma-32 factor
MEQRIEARDLSLDSHAYHDSSVTIVDMLRDETADQEDACVAQEIRQVVRQRLAGAMTEFDERERLIVNERLLGGERRTLADLGRELGLSRERVRQLEQRVKGKLRRSLADLAPPMPLPEAA